MASLDDVSCERDFQLDSDGDIITLQSALTSPE